MGDVVCWEPHPEVVETWCERVFNHDDAHQSGDLSWSDGPVAAVARVLAEADGRGWSHRRYIVMARAVVERLG